MNRRVFLAGSSALALSACTVETGEANVHIFVLVDLSETWHNPASDKRNLDVLTEIGAGIADAADNFDPPISVQHHIIGKGSLERPPLCDAFYTASITSNHKAKPLYLVGKLPKLRQYLTFDCPRALLAQPFEPLTEITATIETAANQPTTPKAKRFMIIASDFLEEAPGTETARAIDLSGFKILMVYRPLVEDEVAQSNMRQRVEGWRDRLAHQRATVTAIPDTALKRTTITGFLSR